MKITIEINLHKGKNLRDNWEFFIALLYSARDLCFGDGLGEGGEFTSPMKDSEGKIVGSFCLKEK